MDVTDIYHDGTQYDLMFGALADGEDLSFYARQAELSGGDVLELGCGTGRLAIPMARRGLSVTGLDMSVSMLARAREKAAEQGVSVEWVQADFRDFDLGRTFGLIFFPANSFQSLLDRPSQEACLACVKRHLAPEGRFVLEVYNPSLRLLTRDPSARFPIQTYQDPNTGGAVTVTENVAYDAATQISHAMWLYEREGDAQPATAHLPLRVIYPQELDALLRYNGLDIEAKDGDFIGSAFTSASARQIAACRARRQAMTVELKYATPLSDAKPLPAMPITYEEFLEWADEDTYAEWVGGEVEFMSPASVPHQDLSGFLAAIMRAYAEENDAGKVLAAPFQMKINAVQRGREPDILFIAEPHLSRLQRNFLDGPADLVIEIVSPESVLRDRGTKYGEYEAAGVREYWVLDPNTARADFFVLDGDGRYQRAQPDARGVYRSAVLPGLWINVGWLWQGPLPTLRYVLREWETSP